MKHFALKPGISISLFILLILILFSCQHQEKRKETMDLKCEYNVNSLGVDVQNPRLSWKIKSDQRGAAQSAYRVLAATDEKLLQSEIPDLWDSGKIESDQSIQVEYNGKPLKSGMKVYWRVQVWDENGALLPDSEIVFWEMGLLDKSDWKAKWIGAPGMESAIGQDLTSPLFRKEFQAEKKIKSARAYISGLGYYELYINGKRVSDHQLSPNQTNYDRRFIEKWDEQRIGNMTTTVLYETFDITSFLNSDDNVFGVWLGNGWYIQADRPNDKPLWYDTPRLIAQFEIEYEDGTKDQIVSDESWKTSASPIIYNGLHSGEIYDARMEQPGWNAPGFKAVTWENAVLVRPPTGTLKSQQSPPDRITQAIKPVSVTEVEKGVYRFDLGEMISGWARLKISGEKGTEINLRFIEELGPTYGQTDTYILKGEGTEIWEPRFTWHAFRFVEIRGSETPLTIDNLEGCVVNTDVKPTGSFYCSDSLLNHILKNYRSTQLGNIHGGIPSDCPHRERRGYTGDGQISAKAAMYNFDMAAFYTKWLNDIGDAQNHKTGYVPNTTPYQDGGGGTAWGAAYVIIPWYMYLYYGDVQILKEHYNGMKHWMDYMENSLDKDGILRNQGLGEWVPPEMVEVPIDFVNTAYYFHCCTLMENIAGVLNDNSDKEHFKKLAEAAKENINHIWFNSKTSNYSIGRQGANIFPLGFGFAETGREDDVFENLVQNLLKNKVHFDTGILATPLLLDVLTEMGRADLAYTIMIQRDFPSFGYMIESGATTIWETWLGDASHSHPMFGSVCQWMYQSLGGISPDEKNPGFKRSIIHPHPIKSLEFANTSYPSAYGDIETHWKWEGDNYYLNLTVPPNTSALVYVLADDSEKITEGDKSIDKSPFIQFQKMDGQNAVFEVQSGSYSFKSKDAKKLLRASILPAPVIFPKDTLASIGDSVKVTISSGVEGASVYYTIDGTEPDSTKNIYTGPFYLTEATEVKAKSLKKGFVASFQQNDVVDFMNPEINGLTYQYFEGVWTEIPDFSKLKSVKTGFVYEFGLDEIYPAKDEFALQFTGKIMIEKAGEYEFFIHSNDGSRLFIDNKLVVDHRGLHGADLEKTGKINLETGMHTIHLDYFQAGGGMFLSVEYAAVELEKQDIPAKVLYRQ